MKNRIIFSALLAILFATGANAQEALFGGQEIESPEIHDDKSVTFRFLAPNADEVQVTGDFLPREEVQTENGTAEVPGKASLAKEDNGVWSFTSKPLTSELYSYSFIVDGLTVKDPNNPFLIRDVASVTNIFIIDGGQADWYEINDIPHGTVASRWYNSPELGMDRRISIYTPPGYEASNESYPVLYLLHGAGGDEQAWLELGRAAQIMDNLIAKGEAEPMIVVIPNGNAGQDAAPGQGADGFYKPRFGGGGGPQGAYEASFKDIINFVESNYRAIKDKEHRAIAGLSMGGFHSFHISRFYPNTFDYVGLFSAAIMPRDNTTSEVYANIDETLQNQMDNGYELYWIAIGKTDFLYQANADFRKKLDEMGMPYEYVETEGGHIWRNWRVYLTQFVPRLFD